jgi:UDP-N-acetylmuramate dehydrogenase
MKKLDGLNSLGSDQKVAGLITINSEEDVREHCGHVKRLIIGECNNLVVSSSFSGLVLLNKLKGRSIQELSFCYDIKIGSGESWLSVVEWALEEGMCGLEALAGIPGSVGAVALSGATAFGVDITTFIKQIDCIDMSSGQSFSIKPIEIGHYFGSNFSGQSGIFVTSVSFRLPKVWGGVEDRERLIGLEDPSPFDIFQQVLAYRNAPLSPKVKEHIKFCCQKFGVCNSLVTEGVLRLSDIQESYQDLTPDGWVDGSLAIIERWRFLSELKKCILN